MALFAAIYKRNERDQRAKISFSTVVSAERRSSSRAALGAPCPCGSEFARAAPEYLKLALDSRKVGSRLIGLLQRKDAFFWHPHVMTEYG